MNSSRSRALRHSMKRTSLSTNRNMSFSISHSGNHSRSNNLNTLPSLEERRSGQHWRTVSRLRSRELWQILGAADSPSRAWAAHLRPGSAGHGTVDGTRWESLYPSPARCLTGLGPNPHQTVTVPVTPPPSRPHIANTGATFARSVGKLSQKSGGSLPADFPQTTRRNRDCKNGQRQQARHFVGRTLSSFDDLDPSLSVGQSPSCPQSAGRTACIAGQTL